MKGVTGAVGCARCGGEGREIATRRRLKRSMLGAAGGGYCCGSTEDSDSLWVFGCVEEFKGKKKKTEGRRNSNREKKTTGRVVVKMHSSIEEREGAGEKIREGDNTQRSRQERFFQFHFISSTNRIHWYIYVTNLQPPTQLINYPPLQVVICNN